MTNKTLCVRRIKTKSTVGKRKENRWCVEVSTHQNDPLTVYKSQILRCSAMHPSAKSLTWALGHRVSCFRRAERVSSTFCQARPPACESAVLGVGWFMLPTLFPVETGAPLCFAGPPLAAGLCLALSRCRVGHHSLRLPTPAKKVTPGLMRAARSAGYLLGPPKLGPLQEVKLLSEVFD